MLERPPGGMVATVARARVEVHADADVTKTPVAIELVDAGRVVDRTTFDAGSLQAGGTIRRTVGFPNAPADGWTVQPDAECVASAG